MHLHLLMTVKVNNLTCKHIVTLFYFCIGGFGKQASAPMNQQQTNQSNKPPQGKSPMGSGYTGQYLKMIVL